MATSNMYANTKTWGVAAGCLFDCSYCLFDCSYCKPSFKRQAKRRKHRCMDCYNFRPHFHPERLGKIPSAEIVFVCGGGDISFCNPHEIRQIIEAIKDHNLRCPNKTYYFQSKNPAYFTDFQAVLPGNVVLVTTLETNCDEGYGEISRAPPPSKRYRDFLRLGWPRKVVTIEPVMAFDLPIFARRIIGIQPEYVWLGFNSRPESVTLPDPPLLEVRLLMERLVRAGIEVRGKDLRGLEVPNVVS